MRRPLRVLCAAALAMAVPTFSVAQPRPSPQTVAAMPVHPPGPGRLALAAAQSAEDEVVLPRVEVRARTTAPRPAQEAARVVRNARLCFRPVVTVRRQRSGEMPSWTGPLTDCAGRPTVAALAAVSLLAQPGRIGDIDVASAAQQLRAAAPAAGLALADDRPTRPRARPRLHAPGPQITRDRLTHDPVIMLTRTARVLHPRVIQLLQALFDRFPGRVAEIISGYRPGESRSRHAHARALDLRLRGVRHEDMRDFARTLPNAGVGYYPNSVFVHLDTRDANEGAAFWTDFSGPGETPRYGHWPPTDQEVRSEVEWMVNDRENELNDARDRELSTPPVAPSDTPPASP